MPTQARSIQFPVGKDARNFGPDVRVVQELLNAGLEGNAKFKAAGIAKLEVDGDCGDATIGAIVAWQTKVLGWSGRAVDGKVEPNKTTWKSLNGNETSLGGICIQVEARPSRIDGFNAFRQGDFSTVQLGSGSLNIGGHGCALCTLTMAASVIGTPTKHWPAKLLPMDLDPPAANTIIRKAGGFSGSSLIMGTAAEALGMNYEEYGRSAPLKPTDVGFIRSHLAYAYPVAAHVDYKSSGIGDHWILVTRRNGASYDAIDPATGRHMVLTDSPMSTAGTGAMSRTTSVANGVLFGWGGGGSKNQQLYVVVRFGLLSPAAGGVCSAS